MKQLATFIMALVLIGCFQINNQFTKYITVKSNLTFNKADLFESKVVLRSTFQPSDTMDYGRIPLKKFEFNPDFVPNDTLLKAPKKHPAKGKDRKKYKIEYDELPVKIIEKEYFYLDGISAGQKLGYCYMIETTPALHKINSLCYYNGPNVLPSNLIRRIYCGHYKLEADSTVKMALPYDGNKMAFYMGTLTSKGLVIHKGSHPERLLSLKNKRKAPLYYFDENALLTIANVFKTAITDSSGIAYKRMGSDFQFVYSLNNGRSYTIQDTVDQLYVAPNFWAINISSTVDTSGYSQHANMNNKLVFEFPEEFKLQLQSVRDTNTTERIRKRKIKSK
jgi:hypothetical protein